MGDEFSDNDISIKNLPKIYRRDRGNRGGGVIIYHRESIVTKRLKEIEPPDSEIVCLDIQMPNSPKHILLCHCYRPDTRQILDIISDLMDIHDYSLKNNFFMSIFVGDFNTGCWQESAGACMGWVLEPPLSMWQ